MKTLILIILKIGESIGILLFFGLLTLIAFGIVYITPENIIEILTNFFHTTIGWIVAIIIWTASGLFWIIYFITNFKKWITQNKEWSNNIYNKLKSK